MFQFQLLIVKECIYRIIKLSLCGIKQSLNDSLFVAIISWTKPHFDVPNLDLFIIQEFL